MSDKGAIIALYNYALNTEANLTEVREGQRQGDRGLQCGESDGSSFSLHTCNWFIASRLA